MRSPDDDGLGEPVTYVQRIIEDALNASELTYSRHKGAHGGLPGLVVELPGERRLKTNTILSIGEHSVRIEAFVCRQPDENFEGVYRYLLKRNRRLYGVAYTLDNVGDIYLVGRLALASVDAAEIDRILGQVLEAVDADFNTLLELGFRTSIQKEWDWRVSRGESLKNLEAFAHLRPTTMQAAERSEEESGHRIDEEEAGDRVDRADSPETLRTVGGLDGEPGYQGA